MEATKSGPADRTSPFSLLFCPLTICVWPQCLVQFFAWIGWFPVLFFSTVYIGDIYTHAVPPPTIPADTTLSEQATRVGFRALLFSALIGLATIIILPIAVARVQSRMKIRHLGGGLAELWCLSQAFFAFSMAGTWWIRPGDVWGATVIISSTGFCFAVTQWVPFSLVRIPLPLRLPPLKQLLVTENIHSSAKRY